MALAVGSLAFLGFGGPELLLVLLLFLLLFGVEAIPKMARELGKAQATFTRIKDDVMAEVEREERGVTKELEDFEVYREEQMRAQAVTEAEEPATDERTGE